MNVIEDDGEGVIIDGVRYEFVSDSHNCPLCEGMRLGDYRDGNEFWQCRDCGSVFEVGVTW